MTFAEIEKMKQVLIEMYSSRPEMLKVFEQGMREGSGLAEFEMCEELNLHKGY